MKTHNLIAAMLIAVLAVAASSGFIASSLAGGDDALHSLVSVLYPDEGTPLNVLAPFQSEFNDPVMKLGVQAIDDGTQFSQNA